MVEITFLGGCLQIGGSAITIETPSVNVLMDYGIYMKSTPSFPEEVRPKDIDAILLTHAHLDHSGGLPLLFSGTAVPQLFATPLTIDLTQLLIFDMIRISDYYLPFGKSELLRMTSNTKRVSYGKKKINSKCEAQFLDAGHIPGSCALNLELDEKRILYTGDFNTNNTQLLKKADLKFSKLDCLIIESTYALEEHPSREETEKKFVARINEIVNLGGTVLIPAFGVARSQEILCILHKYNFKFPIFLDGMARVVARIFSEYPNYFRNSNLFKNALKQAHLITRGKNKEEERLKAASTPGVIIAPSGMLKGGTAVNYMDQLAQNPENGIFLVSFQIPTTPGRLLIDTNKWGEEDVRAQVEFFNFSSHAGRRGLWDLIHALESYPDVTVFCMHGEEASCKRFAQEINETTQLNAIAPERKEIFTI
ncbi:MAG TPA: MBL fold metallo-hydrolase [Candidatus Deferrimicrobium sp.]|nr:MBL fold metallo-hydrolase [Candidatus Deferrimicrobium sp.]